MNEADNNNQASKQKASYPAIWSLVLSICGAVCFLAFFTMEYLTCCIAVLGVPCCALASLLGIAAIMQKTQRYRRLWWLGIVGISISAISTTLFLVWYVPFAWWLMTL